MTETTTATERPAPKVDLPLSQASQQLFGMEVIGIQKHYGKPMEQLSGTELVMGTVWAFQNRSEKTDWSTVERTMTLRDYSTYFADEPKEPDGEVGKE